MHNKKLLKDIVIVNTTERLPGPLCSYLLSEMGAKVFRVIQNNKPDPFSTSELNLFDSTFKNWFEKIHANQELIYVDDFSEIHSKIRNIDVIIGSQKTINQLKRTDKTLVYLKVQASRDPLKKSLHDLNALALSGLLSIHVEQNIKSHVVRPPFLPVAGIMFAQSMATQVLAMLLERHKNNCVVEDTIYLDEVVQLFSQVFYKNDQPFVSLHNGKYPCYNIYTLADGKHLALAAIEEKFWINFNKCFAFNYSLEDRFDPNNRVIGELETFFRQKKSSELLKICQGQDICLSLF